MARLCRHADRCAAPQPPTPLPRPCVSGHCLKANPQPSTLVRMHSPGLEREHSALRPRGLMPWHRPQKQLRRPARAHLGREGRNTVTPAMLKGLLHESSCTNHRIVARFEGVRSKGATCPGAAC